MQLQHNRDTLFRNKILDAILMDSFNNAKQTVVTMKALTGTLRVMYRI